MSDLTKQYFDKQLGKLATKDEISKLATKEDLKSEIAGLESKIEDEVASLARITKNGLEEIKLELDMRKQYQNLERRVFSIEQALDVKH